MQSGVIKHWYQNKGYGFIEVDSQSEDVFFHVSKVRLSQPITVGQSVYFTSERNAKNQLRATKVTSSPLSIHHNIESGVPSKMPNNPNRGSRNANYRSTSKRGVGSTLFSFIAIIAVAVYFLGDFNSTLFADSVESTTLSQNTANSTSQTITAGITGDAQIDNTITLIQQGGPFPYPHKDGTTFYNREGRLPVQSQGYYREYTVPTPELSHRGPRRIVTGGHPPTVYYLTVDHYDSFRRLEVK